MQEYIQLGATVVVSIAFIRLIEFLVDRLVKKNGNGIVPAIKEVGENHLDHIYTELRNQRAINTEYQKKSIEQHDKQIELLTILVTLQKK